MKKKCLFKKVTASLLCAASIISVVAANTVPVHATTVGEHIEVEQETTPTQTDPYWDEIPDFSEQYEAKKETSQPEVEEDVQEEELTGSGTLLLQLIAPEGLDQDVLVELYDKDNNETVQIPVFKINDWYARINLPAGNYMVYSVLANGDDALNPEWLFELRGKVTIKNNESTSLEIKNLHDEAPESTEGDKTTDTGLNPEDVMTDEEIKAMEDANKPLGKRIGEFLLFLVSGPNFVILSVLVGSCIAAWILKKKREDN